MPSWSAPSVRVLAAAFLAGVSSFACATAVKPTSDSDNEDYFLRPDAGSNSDDSTINAPVSNRLPGAMTPSPTSGQGGEGNEPSSTTDAGMMDDSSNAGSSQGGAQSVGGSGGEAGGSNPQPVLTPGFSVEYEVRATGDSSPTISCRIHILNSGKTDVPLGELKVRYYFTNEVKTASSLDLWIAQIDYGVTDLMGVAHATLVDMPMAVTGADTYAEFTFDAGAPAIEYGQRVTLDWQVRNDSSDSYNQANDYSFDASKTEPTEWDRITVLRGDNVIWGTAL